MHPYASFTPRGPVRKKLRPESEILKDMVKAGALRERRRLQTRGIHEGYLYHNAENARSIWRSAQCVRRRIPVGMQRPSIAWRFSLVKLGSIDWLAYYARDFSILVGTMSLEVGLYHRDKRPICVVEPAGHVY
jgi:hypothetical protein